MITVRSGEGPETLTDEGHGSVASPGPRTISLIPSHSFQTSAISRGSDTAAKCPGAGAARVGEAGSRAGGWTVGGSVITATQEPFSQTAARLRQGLGPLKGHGALLPDGGLADLPHNVKELLPPPTVLSPLSALRVPFPVTPQAAWGKWWAQGLTEGKQINIVLMWKKKKVQGEQCGMA